MLQWMRTDSSSGHVFPFLLSKYLGVEVLGCMVSMCLLLKETIKLFCGEAIPLHISTSNYEDSIFSTSSSTLGIGLFKLSWGA